MFYRKRRYLNQEFKFYMPKNASFLLKNCKNHQALGLPPYWWSSCIWWLKVCLQIIKGCPNAIS